MIVTLFFVAFAVALVSWAASFGSRRLAREVGAIDQPAGGRKIHSQPTPLLGGLGIGTALIAALLIGLRFHAFAPKVDDAQIYGFIGALILLMFVGYLDDRFDLPPVWRLVFYIAACFIVVQTGTSITHVTSWSGHGAYSLVWGKLGPFTYPADLLTLVWLLSVTIAMKYLDGLDGLVSGLTVIGSGLIASIAMSSVYYEPPIAVMAALTGGAYLGFLPVNVHPAKQFLGEAGSAIAGFALGFLAVVSGAKIAVALMALGLPLVDAAVVTIGRLLRGASPWKGDRTHIHHRLLDAGLTQRQIVFILWGIALLFGIAALGMQTRGKVFLFGALVVVTVLLSSIIRFFRQRGSDVHG